MPGSHWSAAALRIPLKFGTSLRVCLGGDFAASITPARSGAEPARFLVLAAMEFWERFAMSGMKSLLVLILVDHVLAPDEGDEAVIEWTLFWTPPETGVRVATRGAEWYVFDGGLIKEIRAYYRQEHADSGLEGFPYAERGFSLHGAEHSVVQPPTTGS